MRVTAVVFDWAGTILDHGSRAPVMAMQDVFSHAGVPVTVPEVRLSMGIAKRDHIGDILRLPRIGSAWEEKYGDPPDESDLDTLYTDFLQRQFRCLDRFSTLIAGIPEAAEALRSRAVRIGSTTGYTRTMLEFLVERARNQGFAADCAACPADVPGGGRPAPWMCYLNAIRLEVHPLWSMVKIGDTPSDIEEGLNAGMWTIGVTRTGNECGLTEEEWKSSAEHERAAIIETARARLRAAGSHYLIESAAACVDVIDEIAGRISAGERP